ncbi:ribonuclease HII [Desulfoprunum benzoelyticum]|uniref:Ribonuclease HII n=1 Tax=Desulfoprunum benzoelyticum TaxID=1506996 RepID=A0A840URR8_9BACT|nr:ribonuclease HII [Desulfoprunum benzoelyticum]MBB5348917.1 ribonuclease HII [Desulfoprunum benzoelyticum]MBM9530153.1 ribonuclease HII [Desulfoprunum benzoelyticum]
MLTGHGSGPAGAEDGSGARDSFHHERLLLAQGYSRIAGADEAGRGPLAGPVVASCVILPAACDYTIFRDSKTLSPARRAELCRQLTAIGAHIGVGIVSASAIDAINILRASLEAMRLAYEDLGRRHHPAPEFILVDGRFTFPAAVPQEALVKGDARSASIAAASIVAKVRRDAIMDELHRQFPVYGFSRHKGYPTKEHRTAIARYGPCPEHRRTFKGVREFVR